MLFICAEFKSIFSLLQLSNLMKKLLLLVVCALLSSTASFAIVSNSAATAPQFTQAFGQQLTLKEKLSLKVAQKAAKSQSPAKAADISKGVYILLAIVGLGWLAMGLLDDFDGSDWIISLVLYVLGFWIVGFIYTLIKMKKYY